MAARFLRCLLYLFGSGSRDVGKGDIRQVEMALHDSHELVEECPARQHLAGHRCRPGDVASKMALLRPDRRWDRFAEKGWSESKHVGQRIDCHVGSRARTGQTGKEWCGEKGCQYG